MRYLAQIILLATAWLLWSGHYEPLILLFGVGSILLVMWLAHRMNLVDDESNPYHLAHRPLIYGPWLAKEILMSNLHVARVVLTPSLPIHPKIVRVQTTQHTDLGRVIYANSITITPGTISLDLRDGYIMVHALTDNTREGVESGEMDAQVTKLEGAS